MSYIVAIPTYNRESTITSKTLLSLRQGCVDSNKIYIFVADRDQYDKYESVIPRDLYNEIIVGELGINNQRKFITNYFPENQYIVSIDDDVEELLRLQGDELIRVENLDQFFLDAYKLLEKEKLFIWGVYPVNNAFFMKDKITTDLKFIVGVLFGYINRKLKSLEPSPEIQVKEDYELSILYYKKDGGMIRYNNIVPKTKYNAVGGCGKNRLEQNKIAAEYLKKTYPDLVSIFVRKNGNAEIKLKRKIRV
jgi:hypothetical protein